MAHFDGSPMPDMILDPMTYLGRVRERDDHGKPRVLEVFYDDDSIKIADGDEFITFTTTVLLEVLGSGD